MSLTNNQCIDYEKIYDDYYPNQTGAIYHQYDVPGNLENTYPFLEIIKDSCIPFNTKKSTADPNSRVYGYNKDGSLDLNGGERKSYNSKRKFHSRYHANEEALSYNGSPDPTVAKLENLTPQVVKDIYKDIISYSTARGMQIQGPDNFKNFKKTYLSSFVLQTGPTTSARAFISITPIYTNKKFSYVDLIATNVKPILDTYQPDLNLRENGHAYPIRIPVTRDCNVFQNKYNLSPIAYYDKKCSALTIHVPEIEQFLLLKTVVNTDIPDLQTDIELYLLAFNASFSILRRNSKNELVATCIKCADVLAQVSDNLFFKNKLLNLADPSSPTSTITTRNYPIRNSFNYAPYFDPTVYYVGVVAPLMGGGSPSYDTYVFPSVGEQGFNTGGFESPTDPIQIPEQGSYSEGDNPVTSLIEKYSGLSRITLFDNPIITRFIYDLNLDFINLYLTPNNPQFIPENIATSPIPQGTSVSKCMELVTAHEFVHQMEITAGVNSVLPAEGMAVGIELDSRMTGKSVTIARAGEYASIYQLFTRGENTMMTSDTQRPLQSRYGNGLFWKYLQDQFDYNNQSMRRTMDILTNETLGPLAQSYNFPKTAVPYPNNTGGSYALLKSFSELFNKDIKDVWNDFSVSLVLLRNNTSIPHKYRTYFPFWLYNTQYPGFGTVFDSASLLSAGQFADWWEKMDTNQIIPSDWNTASYPSQYVGQTALETLTDISFSLKNLMSYSFNVLHSTDNIKIKVTRGTWRITLLQFTSDGTAVGSFKEYIANIVEGDPEYIFPVSSLGFTESGNIRLVCCNLTFFGTGSSLEDYFSPEVSTGTISIITNPGVSGFLAYDDYTNANIQDVGDSVPFAWGIKFDQSQLAPYAGTSLTKIQFFSVVDVVLNLYIFQGDVTDGSTFVYFQEISGVIPNTYATVDLTTPVPIDITKPLWITLFYDSDDAQFVAATGNPLSGISNESSLVTEDFVNWFSLADIGFTGTWNLRGFVTDSIGPMVNVLENKPHFQPLTNVQNGEQPKLKCKKNTIQSTVKCNRRVCL